MKKNATFFVMLFAITFFLFCFSSCGEKSLSDNELISVKLSEGNNHVLTSTYVFQDNGKCHFTDIEDGEVLLDIENPFEANKEKHIIYFTGHSRDLAIVFDLDKQTCLITLDEIARSYADGNPGAEDYFNDDHSISERVDQINWDAVNNYFNGGE